MYQRQFANEWSDEEEADVVEIASSTDEEYERITNIDIKPRYKNNKFDSIFESMPLTLAQRGYSQCNQTTVVRQPFYECINVKSTTILLNEAHGRHHSTMNSAPKRMADYPNARLRRKVSKIKHLNINRRHLNKIYGIVRFIWIFCIAERLCTR